MDAGAEPRPVQVVGAGPIRLRKHRPWRLPRGEQPSGRPCGVPDRDDGFPGTQPLWRLPLLPRIDDLWDVDYGIVLEVYHWAEDIVRSTPRNKPHVLLMRHWLRRILQSHARHRLLLDPHPHAPERARGILVRADRLVSDVSARVLEGHLCDEAGYGAHDGLLHIHTCCGHHALLRRELCSWWPLVSLPPGSCVQRERRLLREACVLPQAPYDACPSLHEPGCALSLPLQRGKVL
mmetsp:Transcript_97719/g.209691  ORF Transcript_97719/g.209691 Transcript_97719/m.209691 type:complete len:235 (-) Transcript_97719:646-1350(-)